MSDFDPDYWGARIRAAAQVVPKGEAVMGEKMTLEQAMRRAFSLGQTYWAQADSESWSQNKKADETRERFSELLRETVDIHLTQPAQAVDVGAVNAVIRELRKVGNWNTRTQFSFPKDFNTWADKLTAALPKDSNGAEGE